MKLTPMLEQYFEIKRQVPDAILFYRLGDFYEMFFEDAERAAPILDLVLTARGKGGESEAPMCGVPHHAVEQYVAKLVRHGFRVALCEQVGDPAAKGIVKREVVRIITPGTATETYLLERDSCYLLALAPSGGTLGAAFLDVSTGDFFVTRYSGPEDARLQDDLARFGPKELVHPRSTGGAPFSRPNAHLPPTAVDDSWFDGDAAFEFLKRHFRTQSLRGFGLEKGDARIAAAGAALRYAEVSHKRGLEHVLDLRIDEDADFLILDASTLENLEIFESRDGGRTASALWNVVDETATPMGTRMLRRWIARPLRDPAAIFERHDAVDELVRDPLLLEAIGSKLRGIADLERLASRLTLGSASPRELLTLASSLRATAELRGILRDAMGPLLGRLRDGLDSLDDVIEAIRGSIEEEPPASVRDGGAIRAGLDAELDSLREIARDSKSILLRIEAEERDKTSIPSLKIRYNSVFGYYIEVSKANLAKVPERYIRKQTLVNAERYITPELKELEERIVGAEEKSLAIEIRLYEDLLGRLGGRCGAILATARAVGSIDTLAGLALLARKRRYVRAQLSDVQEIEIEQGRHPVIETLADRFIPNDASIRRDENGVQIVTGPNMGGKSTWLRQVALTVLLNQIGSFVPATSARLGVFDRIFTRVGASDNLARGESTFMVEMHETANILHNATPQSLIVLDEVGRGTATFDGLSLAWAIVEYLHDEPGRTAITLFATHYHELTDLARTRDRIANCNVSVREWNDQIIFLRKVVPGAADKSYGIQVAKLAGIPRSVIERAREILLTLERKERDVVEETRHGRDEMRARNQMSLFDRREDEIARRIRALEVESMSPLEALNTLAELKLILTGKQNG